MSALLLQPQGRLSPAQTLELAQQAPAILKSNPKAFSSSPLLALFSAPETPDLWVVYENLLLSCLKVGNDEAANQCLERLVARFGDKNERVMAYEGLVKEAQATNNNDLERILKGYEEELAENGSNIPIAKRKAALLKSMGKTSESIAALNSLLDFSPTDPETWAELSDLYLSQGLYPQAVFALEEAVVLQPNSWNVHARLGEVELMAFNASTEGISQKHLAESLKRFCRSIELCRDYLRGYYGLKMVTDKLLSGATNTKKDPEAFALPSHSTIQKLNQKATEKLAEIVRNSEAQKPSWQGYNAGEIAAAKSLLSNTAANVIR